MHAHQIRRNCLQRTFTRNAETLYSSEYRNIIIIADARETVNNRRMRQDCEVIKKDYCTQQNVVASIPIPWYYNKCCDFDISFWVILL